MFFLMNRDIAPKHAPWLGMPYHLAITFWGALYRFCNDAKEPFSLFGLKYNPWILFSLLTFILLLPAAFLFGSYFMHGNYWSLRNSFPYLSGMISFIIFTKWLPLRSAFLAKAGNLTYAIYLFHNTLIIAAINAVVYTHPSWLTLPIYIYLPGIVAISSALAWFLYSYVEKPVMDYSKAWLKRRYAPAITASATQ